MRVVITIYDYTPEQMEEGVIKIIRWYILKGRPQVIHLFYGHWFNKTEVEKGKYLCLQCNWFGNKPVQYIANS